MEKEIEKLGKRFLALSINKIVDDLIYSDEKSISLDKELDNEPIEVSSDSFDSDSKQKKPDKKQQKQQKQKKSKRQSDYKKQTIPIAVKKVVWNTYVGEYIGKTKCFCCRTTDIIQMSFHCGHVIAEKNGGTLDITNLRPICQNCNSSMKTTNMNEFIIKHGLWNRK